MERLVEPIGDRTIYQAPIGDIPFTGEVYQLALTKKQREAILVRDKNKSQLRHYSEQRGFYQSDPTKCKECDGLGCPLQVHHIETQRIGGEDEPENLITLYQCEHNGKMANGELVDPTKDFVVHPDMITTFQRYRAGDSQAFAKMFAERNAKIQQGKKYWNDTHDEEFKETAKTNTDNATIMGWIFPKKGSRKH